MPDIKPGAVVYVGAAASIQFRSRPIYFRVATVLDWPASDGWVWLRGYEVNILGEALVERHIFVQAAGVVVLGTRTVPAVGIARTQHSEQSCAE